MPIDADGAKSRTMYRRFRAMEAKADSDGLIRLVASTDEPVRFGSWREVLVHTPGAIDVVGARSLLVNHDADQIVGAIESIEVRDGKLHIAARIMADARLASGVSVRDAVNQNALRGVSIGYDYDMEADTTTDHEARTVTVNRWRFMEVTLTPIPADVTASVRSFPTNPTAAIPAANQKEARVSDAEQNPKPQGEKTAAVTNGDESARAAEMAGLRSRAERAERAVKLRSLADTHGVDVTGLDLASFASEADGVTELLKRKATKEATAIDQPAVRVTKDSGDKLLALCRSSFVALAGVTPDDEDKAAIKLSGNSRAMPMKAILRALARAEGHDSDYWTDMELGQYGSQMLDIRTFRSQHRRDGGAANKISTAFSTLLANVANKAVQEGLSDYSASTWELWCTQRPVANFLQITNTNLASGILTETAENEAFPELAQKDGGYNSTLGLWGTTVSLTWQMLVNDQLGRFMIELRKAGSIAALTVDRTCYSKLLNATWTNDVSASSGLSTPANLDKPRAALKNKLSPAGQKMGTIAQFILHDTANAVAAQVATGAIYGPGQTTAPSLGSAKIQTVESHWIGDTALYASALTTDYYLASNPKLADTVLVNFLEGVGFAPIIMPYDAGAVAAEKWKIMLPFQATIASYANSAATTQFGGLQKAQA